MDQPTRPPVPNQLSEPTQAIEPATADLPLAPPPVYPPGALVPQPTPPGTPPPWVASDDVIGPAPGLRFAPHGPRFVAYIIDGIVSLALMVAVVVVLTLLTAAFAAVGAVPLAVAGAIMVVVAVFAVTLGYFPWFWVNGGATPGMRIFNLRLVRDRDGGPVGWGAAFLRLFGYWVSSLVFYLGYIWIFVDQRHRGWHDLIAGTVMVQPD